MKRTLLIVFLLFAILLSSCGDKADIREQFSLPMHFFATTVGGGSQYHVDITDKYCDIEFCDSSILNGAVIRLEDGKSNISVGEFKFAVDENNFPAMQALTKAIRLLATADAVGIEEEMGVKYTIDETSVLVYYDKDTNKIIGIRTEELGRAFEFTLSDLEPYEAQSDGTSQP